MFPLSNLMGNNCANLAKNGRFIELLLLDHEFFSACPAHALPGVLPEACGLGLFGSNQHL